jgi:AraC-like DNA-binding protein
MQLVGAQAMISRISAVTKGSMIVQDLPMRQKGRYSDCFVFVLSGCTHYDFGTSRCTVRPGNLLYLARDSRYAMRIEAPYHFIYVDFDFAACAEYLDSTVFVLQAFEPIEKLFRRMERRWLPGDFLSRLQCLTDLHEIYAILLEQQSLRYVPSEKAQMMRQTERYLRANLQNPLFSIQALAELAGLSEVHYRRLFKRVFKVSPHQYLVLLRIRRARELLTDGTATITQIAEQTGFASVYYFCRMFRKVTGLTPTEHRRQVP